VSSWFRQSEIEVTGVVTPRIYSAEGLHRHG